MNYVYKKSLIILLLISGCAFGASDNASEELEPEYVKYVKDVLGEDTVLDEDIKQTLGAIQGVLSLTLSGTEEEKKAAFDALYNRLYAQLALGFWGIAGKAYASKHERRKQAYYGLKSILEKKIQHEEYARPLRALMDKIKEKDPEYDWNKAAKWR